MSSIGNLTSQGTQRVSVVGSFKPAGSSAPTALTGGGFTVSVPSTGVYTITFNDPVQAIDGVWCCLEDATLGTFAQISLEGTTGTAGTLTITTVVPTNNSGTLTWTATNLTAATNTRVHFGCQIQGYADNLLR